MILDTIDDKAGMGKWKGDFFIPAYSLPLKLTDPGWRLVGIKKTPHAAGFKNLDIILSEK